jgi:amino acid transporter
VMVCSFILAMPTVAEAARQGDNVFAWLMTQILPGTLGKILWVGIVIANYLCGLACITSTSRMTFAFARDGGLPYSYILRRVSPRWKTPVIAIWAVAGLLILSMLYAPAYSTLTTAGVIFLYISYVMPTAAGYLAYGRSWTRMGPFALKKPFFKFLAVISVLGVLLLVWIGVQPPNQKALVVTIVTVGFLIVAWRLGVREIFRGPPVMSAGAMPENLHAEVAAS